MQDMRGGKDEERNNALAQLKRSFLASEASAEKPAADADAAKLGLMLDVPLCRWNFNILPHHRAALNVFQPMYTLMFEKLLATEPPWIYAHVMLPGGTDNLGNPAFKLEPGSDAPLVGTMMEVVAVQREQDSRLSLLVQGLSRAIVLRPSQETPYVRADMLLLPDAEQLASCAHRTKHLLRASSALNLLRSAQADGGASLQRRLLMAAATAEDQHWEKYENANHSLSMHLTLSQVERKLDAKALAAEEDATLDAALRDAPVDVAMRYGPDGLQLPSPEMAMSAEQQAEEQADKHVWLELDLLLTTLSKLRGPGNKAPVPSQLLGLLPPPPSAGWPKEFESEGLGHVTRQLRERYDGAISEGDVGAIERLVHYVPVDVAYPARRRATRLSYAVWSVIGGQGVELQPVLEAESSADRLRLALLRMRDLMRLVQS